MSDVEERGSSSKSKHRSSKHSSSKDKDRDRKEHKHRDKGRDGEKKHSKRHHRDDDGEDEERHRRHKHRKKEKSSRESKDSGMQIVEDDDDADMWVEKDITADGERPVATTIPTAESLNLTSTASESTAAQLLLSLPAETKRQRDEWMLLPESRPVVPSEAPSKAQRMLDSLGDSLTEDYGDPQGDKRNVDGSIDFFSSLGTEKKKKPKEEKPNPEKLHIVPHLEINRALVEGKSLDEYAPAPAPKPQTPGGPGSTWRMQKLKRTYETAEEEGRPVEEIALERYGTLEAFEEARAERRFLDEKEQRRAGRGSSGLRPTGNGGPDVDEFGREIRRPNQSNETPSRPSGLGSERYMFTDLDDRSRASSRGSSFRKPGESAPGTPGPTGMATPPSSQQQAAANRRVDQLRGGPGSQPQQQQRQGVATPPSKVSTPIPSVLTPQHLTANRPRALSPSSLNKLQAKVLRAKLMGDDNAAELERQYEEERRRTEGGGATEGESNVRVEMVPTIDARGRMYDIGGAGGSSKEPVVGPGNRKKKEVVETRDAKTGELVRYNADDDTTTLGDLLRQEKMGAGMADQKNLDVELAGAIMRDVKFENDLEYMDDNAEKLGRKKMRTDAMKRQFAINDYARTQKALATCQYCYGEDDSPPKAGIIAMGTRAYLATTLFEELTPGHCLIIPIQHHLSMLEADDDVWDEVRNFMKCLMKMHFEEDKGVIFYETVISLKSQKHTAIECVPVPMDLFEDLPAYFKESILASEAEWSQHKKLIDFSKRPGGFRRAMVPNLPYFMVQWDYKGEKGYGHVIEGSGKAGDEDDMDVDDGDKGGGEFPRYFAAEILGNQLDVEPRRWRRPRKMDLKQNKERVAKFKSKYEKFDWTHLIGKS
ncbi:hypothetical protein M407DRAFT_28205 [Tulasnella calospora MUT 4182]|uniref:Cwf19-like C-terminal domain-containing protein n=1 Tax=Tulasnella calospora MUT 4182 TaxID=1051891 RepID=A0A0C3LLN5_9AGAM|nr:hypothetical protein M407DRAFT_28205 [Tulasnella calospora MUT 4182]